MFVVAARRGGWRIAVVLAAIWADVRAVETTDSHEGERQAGAPSLQNAATAGRPTFAELLRAKDAVERLPRVQDAGISGWEWLGPGNVGGRIRAILPLNANTILVGAAAGGIWRSTDAGNTWLPVNDFLASLAVSSLVRDPITGHLYAGTGEGFMVNGSRVDGSAGAGVYESIDGGLTWDQMPSTAAWALDDNDKFVNRVAAFATVVLAATNGGIYRSGDGGPFIKREPGWFTDVKFTGANSAVAGLMTFCDDDDCETTDPNQKIVCAMYSTDGGFNWDPSNFLASPPQFLDSPYAPDDPHLILDSAAPFKNYDIVQIGDSIRVQVGLRNGNALPLLNPKSLSVSFPDSTPVRLVPSQRTELAVVASSPNIVYASIGAGGGTIWKSFDGGAHFSFVSNDTIHDYLYNSLTATRASYDTAIWVAPDDSVLVVGGVEVYRSTDGGVTLTRISNGRYVLPAFGQRGPHVDHHVIVEDANYGAGNFTVYFGNDGGIHKALDITAVGPWDPANQGWSNLNHNLGITQFYRGAATSSPTVEWFIGGGQDNGRPHLRVDDGDEPDVNGWLKPFDNVVTDTLGAVGDDKYGVAVDATDPQNPIFYAASTRLRLLRSIDQGDTWTTQFPDVGSIPSALQAAPFVLDPSVSPAIIVAGTQSIFTSANAASNWTRIRNPIAGTPRASAIDIAASDPETYWVGYEDGTVARTYDGRADSAIANASWTDVSIGGQVAGRLITDIAINPTNRHEAFVTVALDPAGDVDTVWYTSNGGLCWEKRVGSPPFELPRIRIHSVRVDPRDPNRVYVGTDLGVLASADRGLTWNKSPLHPSGPDNDGPPNEGPANVEVWELVWQGDQNLGAATNGRGMFRAAIAPRGPLFEDVSLDSGTNNGGNSQGAAWGDYDGDGDLDLYLANHAGAENVMYRNDGGGSFSEATGAPLNLNVSSIGAAWADYDNDDDLDLVVTNSAGINALFNSAGTSVPEFLNTAVAAGVAHEDISRSVAWADYDNDGYLDLYVANVGANRLYRNDGDRTFTEVAATVGVADSASGQAAAWGDYDNDGDPDLYVTNWSSQPNKLFRNDGGTFVNVADALGIAGTDASLGAAWGDYDNDGDLDLYVVNDGENRLYRNDGALTFVDISATSGTNDGNNGRGPAWVDYDNDGDLDLFVANFGSENKLYRNECCDRFTDISVQSGMDDTSAHRSAVCGDFDGDGSADLYVTSAGENKLYRNFGDAPEGHRWLQVELVGTQSNRNGIGARVRVVSGCADHPRTQIREIASGSGLYSQSALIASFGFGSDSVADTLEITWPWPSGVQQVFTGVALDRKIVVVEDCTGDCLPTDTGVSPGIPTRYALHVNRPNPFNPVTTIRYDLPRRSNVTLRVYDVAGRLVRTLVPDVLLEAGRHQAIWRGRDDAGRNAPSGIYLYRLEAGSFRDQRKMLLLR